MQHLHLLIFFFAFLILAYVSLVSLKSLGVDSSSALLSNLSLITVVEAWRKMQPEGPSTVFANHPFDDTFNWDFMDTSSTGEPINEGECIAMLNRNPTAKSPADPLLTFFDLNGVVNQFSLNNTAAIKAFEATSMFKCSLFKLSFEDTFPGPNTISNISIVTTSTGVGYVFKWWPTLWNRVIYCRNRGVTCFLTIIPKWQLQSRLPHYAKLPGIVNALRFSDYVFFMDFDAFFPEEILKSSQISIESYIPKHSSSDGPTEITFGHWTLPWINTGIMIFRRSEFNAQFIKDWWIAGKTVIDQPSIWHCIFERFQESIDEERIQSLGNASYRYSTEFLDTCKQYGKFCKFNFKRVWEKVFGEKQLPYGRRDFIYMHPNHETEDLPRFHCVYCGKGRNFVFHSGSTHRKIMMTLYVLGNEIKVSPDQLIDES